MRVDVECIPREMPTMANRSFARSAWAVAFATAVLARLAVAQQGPLVPEVFSLDESVQAAIDAEWLTDAERSELRVRHGVWDDDDLGTPAHRATVALNAGRWDDPIFDDPAVPIVVRAEARLHAGDLQDVITLLDGDRSLRGALLRAEAHYGRGDYAASERTLMPLIAALAEDDIDDAATLTDAVRGLALRARLQGQPARDYQIMIDHLARAHQELDRLYWPARLAEAELLLEKHNRREGIQALHETLAQNPRCAWAWYHLGRVAIDVFDFDGANVAIDGLRRLDRDHPLAELLHAESRLVQNDPDDALASLEEIMTRWPRNRTARSLAAAAAAMRYDREAADAALAEYEELSPGSADAYFDAGRFLSMFRQYDWAAEMLEVAIERQPSWPAPRLELGLMEMQTGRDEKALAVLQALVDLDPFNKRAANSLFLLEDLVGYEAVETEHFVIRYRPGIDRVFVDLMPDVLERIHETVSTRFGWEPVERTIIEVMPDHKRFAVRITGMPHIHTIAACTGPIIALEVPREGKPREHLGTFDWKRVLQHEYTHTITLEQTRFRIPHWLTEAAAVSMELAPRGYDNCVMLAESWKEGTLFDLDEIKWAFVRPRRPGDRGKAYAQGHWMVEFMSEQFGSSALVELLERYFEGEREADAIPHALGVSREQFYEQFLTWAETQIETWGLAATPTLTELSDELRWADPELAIAMAASQQARLDAIVKAMANRVGAPARPRGRAFRGEDWPDLVRPPVKVDDAQVAAWLAAHPDHPDLLEMDLRRRIDKGEDPASLVPMLEHYARVRPVDPYPHRKLAQVHLAGPDPTQAIEHLEVLDVREEKTPVYAQRLSSLYREKGDVEAAYAKIMRAVGIDPYKASMREQAASLAIESGRFDDARVHLVALTLLEPERTRHQKRLERLEEMLE